MRVRSGLPVGVNAAFFDEARRTRALESALSNHLIEREFHEVLLPILDYYEPYKNLLADASNASELGGVSAPGPNKADQLYRFIDRDGQLLALRHDFTPMLARLVAPRVNSWELPVRLFYRGDVVRFQEPRPGLLRESAQLGAEILDAPGTSHEQEVLERFIELLLIGSNGVDSRAQELRRRSELQIVLGLANVLEPLIHAAEDPAAAARAVAKRDRTAAAHAGPELLQVVTEGVPRDPASLGDSERALTDLFALRDQLEQAVAAEGVVVSVDLAEFQDLGTGRGEGEHPYYEGLVFRAYRRGSAQPVGNGGRYDGLFQRLGAEVSAAGFSISLDQLLAAQGAASGHPPSARGQS